MTKRIKLTVEGMTCTSCAAGVKKYLEKKGATDVYVSFENNEANFTYEEIKPIEPLIEGIKNLGYQVSLQDEQNIKLKNSFKALQTKLILSWIFTLPLLAHMFFNHSILANEWVQLILVLVPAYFGFNHFGKSAWASVKNQYLTMDVLIFMGFFAALGYSLYGIISFGGTPLIHNFLFFETAAAIVTFALTGVYIERKSVNETTSAVAELIKIQPQKARIITNENIITEIAANQLKPHDLLLLNTGDKIPADAVVTSGNGLVNESSLTGESIPVNKTIGDVLLAGTVVEEGSFKATVTKIGNETLLAKVIELVKNAQQKKPPIQRLGDKISSFFVPTVIILSVIVFIINTIGGISIKESLIRSVAVLVISCPCAFGLATPTAIAVAVGKAARKGILIKGADTLEHLLQIKTIVFDKTGTLTTGMFKIKAINYFGNYTEQEIINIIYTLEQHSSHPIAQSVIQTLKGNVLTNITSIKEEKGQGITAVYQDKIVRLGSARFLNINGDFNIGLSINNKLVCSIYLTDEIKPDAKNILTKLKKLNYQLVLLSGDKQAICKQVAQELGIPTVYSEKLPHEKFAVIQELQKEGGVIMVGDGINDAAALTYATVGISISGSTETALQSAQVVLTKGNEFKKLYELILFSEQTIKVIKQNYFWALAYNIIAIPLAAFGFLSPMIGSLSMAFSDLIVVGNSLRLNRFKQTE